MDYMRSEDGQFPGDRVWVFPTDEEIAGIKDSAVLVAAYGLGRLIGKAVGRVEKVGGAIARVKGAQALRDGFRSARGGNRIVFEGPLTSGGEWEISQEGIKRDGFWLLGGPGAGG